MKSRISVIVPTRNRATSLRRCLEGLRRQSWPAGTFEVVVVDNGSTDATQECVAAFKEHLRLKVVRVDRPGLHRARHAGIAESEGDLLFFLDDDAVPVSSWVQTGHQVFENEEVGIATGNNFPEWQSPPPGWVRSLWERPGASRRILPQLSVFDFGQGVGELEPRYVWGCNFLVRRQVVEQAGGFHPDAFPAELIRWRGDGESYVSSFAAERGWKVHFAAGASVHHWVSTQRMTTDYFARRAFAQGVSDSYSLIRKLGKRPSRLQGLVMKARRLRLEAGRWVRTLGSLGERRAESRLHGQGESAYWEGFRFHQEEVRIDPSLLEWVLRVDYRE